MQPLGNLLTCKTEVPFVEMSTTRKVVSPGHGDSEQCSPLFSLKKQALILSSRNKACYFVHFVTSVRGCRQSGAMVRLIAGLWKNVKEIER